MAITSDIDSFDGIEGVADPRLCQRIIGHTDIVASFLEAQGAGRLHHAWLLGGPKGIGKASLAYLFTRYLLTPADERIGADGLTFSDAVDAQIIGRAHPNLLVLQRPFDAKTKKFKTQITVEEVRRTVPFFGKTAGGGAQRVCIVDGAEDMNASAANALLKILEEPPVNTTFFVVSHAPGRLLPTILSRCRQVRLDPLSEDDVDRVVRDVIGGNAGQIAKAVGLSQGAPRRAIELLNADMIGLMGEIDAVLGRLQNGSGRVKLAELLAARGNEQAYLFGMQHIFDWLAGQITVQTRAGRNASALASWTDVWEKMTAQFYEAERYNLDKKQTVMATLDALARLTH